MKRILLCISLFLAGAIPAFSQAPITITGTVVDANGRAYAAATGSVTLLPQAVGWTIGGTPVAQTVWGLALDASGSFSVNLPSTSSYDQQNEHPNYTFNFCSSTFPVPPYGTKQSCFSVTALTLTTTQSITTQINAVVISMPQIPGTNVSGAPGSGTVTNVSCVTGCTVTSPTSTPAITVTATGTGNVVGPGSSNTSDAAIFGDTTGKLLADGGGPLPATKAPVTNQWLVGYTLSTGLFTSSQPNFSNLAGSAACGQLPALTGDTTSSAGSCATTTVKLNGVLLSGLATGLLYNTTTTGVPSIATAAQVLSACTGCAPIASPTFTGTVTLPTNTNVPTGDTLTIQSGGTLTCAAGSTCPSGTGTVTGTGTASTPTEFSSSSVIKNGVLADFETFGLLNNTMTTVGDMIGATTSGASARIAAGLTGQVPTATNAATPKFASSGLSGRTASGTTDSIACDSSTATVDRGNLIIYTSTSNVAITVPSAAATGCGSGTQGDSNFYFAVGGAPASGSPNYTFTPTTSTLTVINGATVTAGATSVVLTKGQYATFNSPDNVNYIVRVSPSGGGSNAYPITVSGTVTSGGIPYFSSTTVQTSSALLTNFGVLFGGGAGGAPTSSAQGGSNFPLIGQGAANPIFSTIAYPTSATSGGVICATSTTGLASSAILNTNILLKGGGAGACPSNSLNADNGTTNTYTGTGGNVSPSFNPSGTTATFMDYAQGTTSAAVAPCNAATSRCVQAATAMTASVETLNGIEGQGVRATSGTTSAFQDVSSGDANHSNGATGTSISTATSIGSTSLCSTANCPVGTYQINGYIDVTTACTTTGSYFVTIGYTDDAGAKTIVMPLVGTGVTASILTATGISSSLAMSSTSNFAQGDLFIRSTGAAAINYTTTAGACATGGPGLGHMYLSVVPVQ